MHRRHAHVDRDLLFDDVLDGGRGIEARMKHELRAQPKSKQHDDGERIDVEQRQDAEEALLALAQALFAARNHFGVERAGRGQIGVRQHRALGRTGRAAGVLNDGQFVGERAERMSLIAAVVVGELTERDMAIVALDLGEHSRGGHLRFDGSGRRRHLREFANDQRFEAGRSEQFLRLRIERGEVERDEDVGLAVIDLRLERRQRVQRRVVDDRAARLQHAEERNDVMGRVGQVEPDMDAGLNSELLEARRRAVRERVELRVGRPLVHEVERRLWAEALGGLLQDALHGRELERRVPAHVRRIGLQPRPSCHLLRLQGFLPFFVTSRG